MSADGSARRAWLLVPAALAGGLFLADTTAPAERPSDAVSLGQANGGSLRGGVGLPERGPGFLSRPSRNGFDGKYGTEELIRAIEHTAAFVEHRAPGATLYVGDLGFATGGPLPGHESHQAGRDVDLLFYVVDEHGVVARPRGSAFNDRGRAIEADAGTGTVFDTRRNWLVLRGLVEDEQANLQRVLVSEGLRTLVLDHARRQGEPAWIIERVAEATCDSWSPHADHFHVRLYCTAHDYRQGCRDEYPLYPWRRTQLAARGLLDPVVLIDPNRQGARARRWLSRPQLRTFCP